MMPWALIQFGGSFALLGLLAWAFPCNEDHPRFFPKGFVDDILYFVVSLLAYGNVVASLYNLLTHFSAGSYFATSVAGFVQSELRVSGLPLAVQCIIFFLAIDLLQYWLHRLFHESPLWHVHAVHHSAEHVTWLTSFRFHPLNEIAYMCVSASVVCIFGFSPEVIAVVLPIGMVHALLVHANVNWTFGPLRYVIASPVFHRWHHAGNTADQSINFAPTFPLIDLAFGTFYMPMGQRPDDFGCADVPSNFVGQMLHPFVMGAAMIRRAAIAFSRAV